MSDFILPLEEQVSSRETCERLKDAGFPMQTRFFWTGHATKHAVGEFRLKRDSFNALYADGHRPILPAPTATELLEVLPNAVEVKYAMYWLQINRTPKGRYQIYYYRHGCSPLHRMPDERLVEAASWLYLRLHERDLLPPESHTHPTPTRP